jgi:hypothetical protein
MKQSRFLCGDLVVERVDRYVYIYTYAYLGATLGEYLSFRTAKSIFFNKANIKATNLHSVIFRSKIENFTSHNFSSV